MLLNQVMALDFPCQSWLTKYMYVVEIQITETGPILVLDRRVWLNPKVACIYQPFRILPTVFVIVFSFRQMSADYFL